MSKYYSNRSSRALTSRGLADHGPLEDPNPGESSRGIEGAGTLQTSTGRSTAGASGGGDQRAIGIGAQVGIKRNLEYAAGGRAHRISTGPFRKA